MLIVLPGTIGPSRLLVAVLREQHEDRRAAWRLDNDFREKHGIPSTPDIDWAEEEKRLKALLHVVEEQNADLVRLGHQAGFMAMSASPQDPGEWRSSEVLDGITIRPRHLSASESKSLRIAWVSALSAGDRAAADAAENSLVSRSIFAVGGLRFLDEQGIEKPELQTVELQLQEELFTAFRDAALFPWLLSASLYLQGLPAGKAMRSGVQPPPT
jgi:hypothetical protein